ncbi:MAG: UvrD-helicase domain-containing protein, partial [Armatimonadota bacterium]|nr:UvrD-helicase domain-containing protein [Armatimonadota bacterium]
MEAIFQDSQRPAQARRFDAAHEYAHFFLHDGFCRCTIEDLHTENLTEPAPVGADRVEEHRPRSRRESEANVYAAELLLPDALLRRLFFEEGQSADQIAEAVGLVPALALAQMTAVLLLPPLATAAEAEPTPAAQAVTLDPFQCAAAEFPAGPLLLGAGPGTGKTKTLVGRCQFLIRENVPPEKILCLTFSRDAAQEMEERLAQAGVGSGDAKPWVGTFHSFGMELLKRYGERIGLKGEARLLGPLDAVTLLENNLARLELDVLDNLYNPALHLKGILKQISRAKDELVTPEQYQHLCQAMQAEADRAAAAFAARPGKKTAKDQEVVDKAVRQAAKAAEISRGYAVYETLLAEQGFLDFGDLIYRSVQLLETCPDVRATLQAEFPHILADEYQDVNRACASLIRLLAGDAAEGLWAVGDHRQSIYRFRGASPANVAAFKADYPNGQRRELGVNYRSLQPIVDCFGAVARALTPPAERDAFEGWQANRGMGVEAEPVVTAATAPDDEGQAAGIAGLIQQMRPVHPYPQQAILCRTHAQAQALVELLSVRDIPVLYLGNLMDRPEIKDLLCLLSLFSPEAALGLLRVGALPEYGISQDDVLEFLARARQADIPISAALQDPVLSEGLAAEQGLRRLGPQVAELSALQNDPAALLRDYLFRRSQFLRHLT